MAYSKIIDDILDKVFVEIFGNSRKNPPPWFNQFVGIPGNMTLEEYEIKLDACIEALRHYFNNKSWNEKAFNDFMDLLPSLWQ